MNIYQEKFWNLFNLLMKIMGWFWLIGGLFAAALVSFNALISGGIYLDTIMPNSGNVIKTIYISVWYFIALFGFLFIRAKPYYPKENKEYKSDVDKILRE